MNSELQRASLYFRFIKGEHAHFQEIFERGRKEMLEALSRVRVGTSGTQNQTHNQQENPKSNVEDKISEQLADLPAELKKLYRKIAVETHPDKLINAKISEKERLKKSEAYVKAVAAFDKKDADALIEIAVDLEIETNLPEEQVAQSLRTRGKLLEQEIERIKNTPEWFWAHASEQQKIDVIKQICQRNGWIYVTDEVIVETVRYVSGMHPGSKSDIQARARKLMQERRRLS